MPDSKSRKLAGAYQSSAQSYQLKANRYNTFDSADITSTIVNKVYIDGIVDSATVDMIDSNYVSVRADVQTQLATTTYGTVGAMTVAKYLTTGQVNVGGTVAGSTIVCNTEAGQALNQSALFTGTWRNLGCDQLNDTAYTAVQALLVRIA